MIAGEESTSKISLIVGGDGQIGSALARDWRYDGKIFDHSTRRKHLVSARRPYIDLEESADTCNLSIYSESVICAGISTILECETDPVRTRRVNVQNTTSLVNRLVDKGVYVLFLSSSQVFNGALPYRLINDEVSPTTEYGRQKVEAERSILGMGNSAVLRITKVLHEDSGILHAWRKELSEGKKIFPYSNILLSPVTLDKVTNKIGDMLINTPKGCFHLGGLEEISYAKLAQEYCEMWRLDQKLILPTSVSPSTLVPLHSSLA